MKGGSQVAACGPSSRNYRTDSINGHRDMLATKLHRLFFSYRFPKHQQRSDTRFDAPLKILIDSGCSNHMVDSQLLPNVEDEMLDYVRFDPPMTVAAAGGHLLHGTGKGVLHAMVTDLRGNQ